MSEDPLDKRRLRVVRYVVGSPYEDPLTGKPVVVGGCVSCNDTHEDGDLLVEYDDGEYMPQFCVPCVLYMVELLIKGVS